MQSQVRFNMVLEKVPEKVPGGFGAEPGHVQQVPKKVPEKVWQALVQSERGHVQQGSQEGSGAGAEPGQVQHGSGEGSGEGLGGFGAEPGDVQQGYGEGCGEGSRKLWCKAKSGSTG